MAVAVGEWLARWTIENELWTWEYDTGGSDTFRLSDELRKAPEVASAAESELTIRIQGQATSTGFWRDWLVLKLIPDLKAAFPEIGSFLTARDCTSFET